VDSELFDRLCGQLAKRAGISARAQRSRIQADIPLGRLADPGDVADAVTFLAGHRARHITGVSLVVAGGQELH
jgi:NAD(P)-dependent dehydrogenase (short-subunit alcohol dehydrogenase family)